jgi:hypothetical protein
VRRGERRREERRGAVSGNCLPFSTAQVTKKSKKINTIDNINNKGKKGVEGKIEDINLQSSTIL